MPVPFGFGTGDILSTIKLLKDIGVALKENGGASANYQAFVQQAESLILVLAEIQHSGVAPGNVHSFNAIKGQAQACEATIVSFLDKISPYAKHLGSQAPQGVAHGIWSKAKWATLLEKNVEKFRESVDQQINALLLLWQIHNQTQTLQSHKSISFMQRDTKTLIETSAASTVAELQHGFVESQASVNIGLHKLEACVLHDINRSNSVFSRGIIESVSTEIQQHGDRSISQLQTISDAMNVTAQSVDLLANKIEDLSRHSPQNHQSLQKTLLETSCSKVTVCTVVQEILLSASQQVVSLTAMIIVLVRNFLRLYLLPQLRSTIQKLNAIPRSPVKLLSTDIQLEDVLGRWHSLPFEYFKYGDVFFRTLECAFRGLPGHDRILKKNFKIINRSMQILDSENWSSKVFPGSKLKMSICVERLRTSSDHCPSSICDGRLSNQCSAYLACDGCSKIYYRFDSGNEIDTQQHPAKGSQQGAYSTLKDLVFQSGESALRDFVQRRTHDHFQSYRRSVAQDFIAYCSEKITKFEALARRLSRVTEAPKAWKRSTLRNGRTDRSKDASGREPRITPPGGIVEFSTELSTIRPSYKYILSQHPTAQVKSMTGSFAAHTSNIERISSQRHLRMLEEGIARDSLEIEHFRRVHTVLLDAEPSTELEFAVQSGKLDSIVKALELIKDINLSEEGQPNVLTLAVESGPGLVVDLLLEIGANPLLSSGKHGSALSAAAVSGRHSLLLSLLSAIDCFYESHIKTTLNALTFAEAVHGPFHSAVAANQQAAVELFLYFGSDPLFKTRPTNTSALEIAMQHGHDDLIASFILVLAERSLINSVQIHKMLQFIRKSSAQPETLPADIFPGQNLVYHRSQATGKTTLDFLDAGSDRYSIFVLRTAPLLTIADMGPDDSSFASIERDLLLPLQELRLYFVANQTDQTSLTEYILKFIDRAVEAVRDLQGHHQRTRVIAEFLVSELLGQEVWDMMKSLTMLTRVVDSNFGDFSRPSLNSDAYWRLQADGFTQVCQKLTAVKLMMRYLREDLNPFWASLKKVVRKKLVPKFAHEFNRTKSYAGGSFTLTMDVHYDIDNLAQEKNALSKVQIADLKIRMPRAQSNTFRDIPELLRREFQAFERLRL